jgi:hypothetical protein
MYRVQKTTQSLTKLNAHQLIQEKHMSINFSKQSLKKQVLICLGIATIGTSAIFGSATQATATDVKAGPIWNNEDAKVKYPVAAAMFNTERIIHTKE